VAAAVAVVAAAAAAAVVAAVGDTHLGLEPSLPPSSFHQARS